MRFFQVLRNDSPIVQDLRCKVIVRSEMRTKQKKLIVLGVTDGSGGTELDGRVWG